MIKIEDEYLGDGVYASFDGFGIVLDLRGQDNFTRIVLEPQVLRSLNEFEKAIQAAIEREAESGQ